MIKVLNSKSKAELQQINITDRTETILEIKKVLQKKNLLNQLKTKCQTLDTIVQRFHIKFNLLNQRGLPGLVALNERLISLEEYCKKHYTIAIDKDKFAGIKGHMTGKASLEALEFDLIIKHEIKHLFINKPTFEIYTEVNEVFRRLIKLDIPS